MIDRSINRSIDTSTDLGLALDVGRHREFDIYESMVFMELVNNGELFDMVSARPTELLPESISRAITLDLVEGLRACRQVRFIP